MRRNGREAPLCACVHVVFDGMEGNNSYGANISWWSFFISIARGFYARHIMKGRFVRTIKMETDTHRNLSLCGGQKAGIKKKECLVSVD